jgi:TonB family protein
MKKNIFSTVIFFVIFFTGCTNYLENSQQSYTPPVLKSQPILYYPKLAQENSYAGTPKVLLSISHTGMVDKVSILKSSGNGILDSAALNYCRNFVFYPALRNGNAINSRMAIDVKFTFTDKKWNADKYAENVNDLYDQLRLAPPDEKNSIKKDILEMHNEYIENMKDIINYNVFIKRVISPSLSSEWDKDWDSWPLSFLLYYDFMQRFPDFNNMTDARDRFNNSLRSDVEYIKVTAVRNQNLLMEKERLLERIKKFVAANYPEMLNELGFGSKSDTTSNF